MHECSARTESKHNAACSGRLRRDAELARQAGRLRAAGGGARVDGAHGCLFIVACAEQRESAFIALRDGYRADSPSRIG